MTAGTAESAAGDSSSKSARAVLQYRLRRPWMVIPWVCFLERGTKQSVLTDGTAQSVGLTYFCMAGRAAVRLPGVPHRGYEVVSMADGGLH